jgi:predicted HicB family RNase H-like nuclease
MYGRIYKARETMSELEHKTTIRLPKELHTAAKIKAVKQGRSLSAVIREFLEEWVKEDPPEEEEEP